MRLRRKLLFALLPIVALLLLTEIAIRCAYYQKKSGYRLALFHATDRIARKVNEVRLSFVLGRDRLERPADAQKRQADFFNSPAMKLVRDDYFTKYEQAFGDLARLCKEADSLLVVMYLPSWKSSREVARSFYKGLTTKYQIPYLDLTDTFSSYPETAICLLPRNPHISRFGNQVIAKALLDFLKPYLGHRSSVRHDKRPTALGDLRRNHQSIWNIDPAMPYVVATNSQGLRHSSDLVFPKPKDKTRILCMGDSFTFGPYLNDLDCYPQIMEQMDGGVEAINAGIAGYMICDEYSYFEERGRFVEPDMVVLQVLDNDLYGFFPYWQKQFCRGGKYCIYPRRR
ncbi:SGNH/GDSL hydrolase family protein [Candidatus Sumerlaeota bacterium]|nr:SGNH/GDSL hydrolase family protein [Candidatus Sumerlaeota bacterium]